MQRGSALKYLSKEAQVMALDWTSDALVIWHDDEQVEYVTILK